MRSLQEVVQPWPPVDARFPCVQVSLPPPSRSLFRCRYVCVMIGLRYLHQPTAATKSAVHYHRLMRRNWRPAYGVVVPNGFRSASPADSGTNRRTGAAAAAAAGEVHRQCCAHRLPLIVCD